MRKKFQALTCLLAVTVLALLCTSTYFSMCMSPKVHKSQLEAGQGEDSHDCRAGL